MSESVNEKEQNLEELFKDVGKYKKARDLFVDSEKNQYYVSLESINVAYAKLVNSINKDFKIIFVYGEPGTGKTYALQKFYDSYKDKVNIFFYKEPIFNDLELLYIYEKATGKKFEKGATLKTVLQALDDDIKESIYIILDEAQMYDEKRLEWIRILSNKEKIKFVISVHSVDQDHVLAKKHFQTRAFEIIEFYPLNREDTEKYIEKKFLLGKELDVLDMFRKKSFNLIYKFTQGNLRNINRLMYRILEVLEYTQEKPNRFFSREIKEKFIKIAAYDLKMG